MSIRLLVTAFLLVFSCQLAPAQQATPPDISDEDLQKVLFDMEEETCLTTEKGHKDVADAIREHMHPKFVINLFGTPIPLAKVLDIVENHPNPPKTSTIHGRTFVREGNTVIITGFYDRTIEKNGVIQEVKDERFADIFVYSDGKWRFLYSTFERPLAK